MHPVKDVSLIIFFLFVVWCSIWFWLLVLVISCPFNCYIIPKNETYRFIFPCMKHNVSDFDFVMFTKAYCLNLNAPGW